MPQTQDQIAAMFRTAVSHFVTGTLRAGGANWTATVASGAYNTEFGQGGGFESYDLTVTATKPDGAADLKVSQRVLWNNQPYTISRIESVQDGALFVIGLNKGSVPRG